MNVLKGFGKKLASGLAQKLGISSAPATASLPPSPAKLVQARVLNPDAEDIAHGAPLVPKGIVRVVPGNKDNWIKKL